MVKFFGLAAALLAVAVAGCAGPRELGGSPNLTVVDAQALPPPSASDEVAGSRPYRVGPFDELEVDVFGVPDMRREVQADASGRISVPLAGVIEAAGKTPLEISDEIAGRLRGKYVKDPQVSVNLKETVSQVVTVEGEVEEPGLYPVVGDMTLMRAIARAKGVGEFASLEDVVVFRTVEGRKMAALYNLKAIRRGAYDDPKVYANDVVVVGESGTRRLFRDVLQSSPALITPLIYLLN